MSILYSIATKLRKQPKLKRFLKNTYQIVGDIISDRQSSPASIQCVSDYKYEHLFGYYDKSPWNRSGDKIIYLRVKDASSVTASDVPAEIIINNIKTDEETSLTKTNSWNVQQGCMLQWLGPDFETEILFNDFRRGKHCAIIFNVDTKEERIIDVPVYSVSLDGKSALTLDFARLHTLRPGYGYMNAHDRTQDDKCPESPCIWVIDLVSNKVVPIITYKQLFDFEHKESMKQAFHKVNHIMINPSGTRFMFLHRWIKNGVKFDRLLTCRMDGKDIYNLLDEDMVSHCNWKDDTTIIAFAHTHEFGNHYYILHDKSGEREVMDKYLPDVDGHPSYSPDGKYIITDSYPNFKRKQRLYLYDVQAKSCKQIAEVYSSKPYINDTRCDLHPRWKRDSSEICFDGAQGKYRQVYTLKINN
jgi:hypothetical protein